MGYSFSATCEVVIPADKVQDCLAAINLLFKKQSRYSWVEAPKEEHTDLVAALDNWRYEAHVQENGDVEISYFQGEKLGDDKVLFQAIAPFADGVIYCVGEHGEDHWKWAFADGELKECWGRIVYDDWEGV